MWYHPFSVCWLLTEFAVLGIGVHHAGLNLSDRKLTEELYLQKVLRILIATSTLAVGVNLRKPSFSSHA